MTRLIAVFMLALPTIVGAEVWRWTDATGGVHYSNVPGRAPREAVQVRTDLGFVAGEPIGDAEPRSHAAEPPLMYEDIRRERKIKKRLAEIQTFYAQVRARQRARLEAYSNSTLLPDWMVADQWLQLREEERQLRHELATLSSDEDTL